MARVSLTTICEAIENGTFDAGLDRLFDSIATRRKIIANQVLEDLEVGTHVRINNRSKPSYLRGRTGIVENFRRTKVTVRMDQPLPGRFGKFGNRVLICPPSILEVVNPETIPAHIKSGGIF